MIQLYKSFIPQEALVPLGQVFASGQVAEGPRVKSFEDALGAYVENPNLVSAGDVSSAIELCLMVAGVGAGDEVLASPMACVATNQPVLNLRAQVRWSDVSPDTGMITADQLARAVTPRTRAVVLPLWAGDVPELDAIVEIARARGLIVILDAGEALGSEYRGRKIGNTGEDFAVFSFHAIRHITTGEGAAIACRTAAWVDRVRQLKRYAIDRRTFRDALGEINPASDIKEAGLNSYMTDLAGAIGVEQMKRLPGVVQRHRENGMFYDRALVGVAGISLCPRPEHLRSSYWVYTLLAERRDDLLRALRERGVYASKVHLRNDVYSCFAGAKGGLPGVDAFAARYLCVPAGWWVTDEDRERVAEAIRRGW